MPKFALLYFCLFLAILSWRREKAGKDKKENRSANKNVNKSSLFDRKNKSLLQSYLFIVALSDCIMSYNYHYATLCFK